MVQSITVETDHRPLLAVAHETVADMASRLKILFLSLMQFDFNLGFVHGKLLLADTLFRVRIPTAAGTMPKVLRREMLHRVHVGHLGRNKCKARTRLVMYWPGMNAPIETMIKNC